MNLHDLVTAASGDSDLERTIRALVRVAICAAPFNDVGVPPHKCASRCLCDASRELDQALDDLQDIAGPIPETAEAAP